MPSEPNWYDQTDSEAVTKYMEKRLKPFTNKLYRKANSHMSNYYRLQITVIIFGAMISIVNVIDNPAVRIISAVFAAKVVVTTGITQLIKLRETGIIFRIITSRLQNEYHSFIQNIGQYNKNNPDRQKLFIHRTGDLILNATTEYYDLFRNIKDDHKTTT